MKACAVQGLEGSSGIRPQTREHSQQYGQQQGGSPGKGTSLLPLQAGPPPETPRRFLACVGSKWATGRDEQAWLPAGPDGVGGLPTGAEGPQVLFLFFSHPQKSARQERSKRNTPQNTGREVPSLLTVSICHRVCAPSHRGSWRSALPPTAEGRIEDGHRALPAAAPSLSAPLPRCHQGPLPLGSWPASSQGVCSPLALRLKPQEGAGQCWVPPGRVPAWPPTSSRRPPLGLLQHLRAAEPPLGQVGEEQTCRGRELGRGKKPSGEKARKRGDQCRQQPVPSQVLSLWPEAETGFLESKGRAEESRRDAQRAKPSQM